ncbi:hypothetical protein BN59_00499 [Legionella massiliensis]|uniref:Capsule biosynthesis protein n=1 Tax=Legionella massiliensis TaxID=1034943 RepID=A0A078KTE2_9GAMM|nr:DUF6356 family protein [Legionella massiliensis]CDZ76232.1 hypothetical protein BN59_00499 [Legionella massiliensis]CEE11970.1 hypothetical protein BN1094_00499 [Legionella massiliensis]
MKNPFTHHPKNTGETYIGHLFEAIYCGLIMIFSGSVCIIHAFLPFIFTSTASRNLVYLLKRFERRFGKKFL